YLFTVLGPAGIGKSRLAYEFASSVAGEATVVRGGCLPYGEGITFWPLVEIVRALAGGDIRTSLAELLGGDDEAQLVADRAAGALRRAAVLGRRQAERDVDPARAAVAQRRGGADREPPRIRSARRRGARPHRRRRRRQPALPRADARPHRRGGRHGPRARAAEHPGAPLRPPRPPRAGGARAARARVDRRQRVLARRGHGALAGRGARRGAGAPAAARAPRARAAEPLRLPGRRRLPLPAPADPRRGLRLAAEGRARRVARTVRRLDRRARERA